MLAIAMSRKSGLSRRDFLAASAATTATVLLPTGVFAQGSDTLKIGLIGCGGRGTGAAIDAANADKGVVLWSMGDIFKDHMEGSTNTLKENLKERFQVMRTHYGLLPTLAVHAWFVIRGAVKR